MGSRHLFKAKLNWISNDKEVDPIVKSYTRSHTITIEDKPILNVSAAKAFKGNPELYNPEDLLLSSIVSCHMMSYLYVCGQESIELVSYKDEAEATLEVTGEGSGRFTEVRLYPTVIIKQPKMVAKALSLHKKANELCFIANSCNFPVLHFPSCEIE